MYGIKDRKKLRYFKAFRGILRCSCVIFFLAGLFECIVDYRCAQYEDCEQKARSNMSSFFILVINYFLESFFG